MTVAGNDIEPEGMDNALKTYITVLLELTPEQIVLAFSRAVNESNFCHALATLCNSGATP
jgi:hypothetical protein